MFKVYDGKKEIKRPVLLKLRQDGESVSLRAVDSNGYDLTAGVILSIKPNGMVYLMNSINPDLGFSLDADRKIMVQNPTRR